MDGMDRDTLLTIFGSYRAWKFAKQSWCISFMEGTEYIYLLEGEKKALLLDTGYGTGTLASFVRTLTDKPLVVANTHVHPDHAAGNGEFEEVCMSDGYELDRLSVYGEPGPFDLSALPHPDYRRVYLQDGDIIDLGGRRIKVIRALPAHCNSTLFYLDMDGRMFFCGDDMESAQVMMFDNSHNPDAPYEIGERLRNLRGNAQRMKDLADAYEYLLPNHNGTPISMEYPDDYIGLVDHIFAGDALIEDRLNHKYLEMDPKASKLCRVRWKQASIFVEKALLMQVYGKTGKGGNVSCR
jgi:hydroxyacylglutathione hydrolase